MTTATTFAERKAALDARQRQLDAQADQLKRRDAEFAEQTRTARRATHAAFLDGLVKAGTVLPAQKPALLASLCHLEDAAPITFGEGDKRVTKPLVGALKEFLSTLPAQITFGEAAPHELASARAQADVPRGYVVDPERAAIHARALAYQEKHSGTDYITAVRTVSAA